MSAAQEHVWEALLDVETLAGCLPGAEGVHATGPSEYAGTVRARLGPISTRFELSGTVDARNEERWYGVDIRGRERLTGTVVQARFDVRLAADGAATGVGYVLDLTLLGKLGQLGQAVFQDVAQKMTQQTIACLRSRLDASESVPGG